MFIENGKRLALGALAGEEVVQIADSRTSALAVGMGYALAKGWATYKGNGEFSITLAGHEALAEILNPTD